MGLFVNKTWRTVATSRAKTQSSSNAQQLAERQNYGMLLNVFRNMAFLLVAHSTEPFRQYKKIFARRCSNVDALLGSLSADELRCAGTCLQTANCNLFNYNNSTNVSMSNCELLMTSAMDYGALLSATDWCVYSSHPLLTSGNYTYTSMHTKCPQNQLERAVVKALVSDEFCLNLQPHVHSRPPS